MSETDLPPSSPRRFTFLVNPVSGGGAGPRVVVPLARELREAGCTVAVRYTGRIEETPALVAEALAGEPGEGAADDGESVVVAVGGDGMLSSVAGLVADAGGLLGLVPAGRGNDFARALGTPADTAALAALLRTGTPRSIDLLDVADTEGRRTVAGSVYTGVDARVAALVDRSRWLPSLLQYPLASVACLATYRPLHATVEIEGVDGTVSVSEHRVATVVVANSPFYGKGMRIAPHAQVDDAALDIVIIEAAGRADLIRSLPKVYDGGHAALPEVTLRRGRRVRVSGAFAGGTPAPVGADGEPLAPLPADHDRALEVTLRPGALRVLG